MTNVGPIWRRFQKTLTKKVKVTRVSMWVTFFVIRVSMFLNHVKHLLHDCDFYMSSICCMPIWPSLLSSRLTICDDLNLRHTIKTVYAHLITYDSHGNLNYDDNNVQGNNVEYAIVIC